MRRLLIPLALILAGVLAHPAAASCFDGQLPATRWAGAAARSAVRLVLTGPDGAAFGVASGVVVARSGDGADGGNRILTAGHVLRDLDTVPGGALAVWSSDGVPLGLAEPVVVAAPGPAFGLRDPAAPPGLRFGDLAVLRMAGPGPAFAAIPGLRLARRQPGGLLRGDVAEPAGVDPGVSGAAVLGRDGRVLAIMAAKLDDPATPTRRVPVGDPRGSGWIGLDLPAHAVGFATPVADPAILAALGRAGAGVVRTGAKARAIPVVYVPAYPRGACVVFRAAMGPT